MAFLTPTQQIVKPKILIVDDDQPTRMLLRATIKQCDLTALEAVDGEEALSIFTGPEPPRMGILDWMMPKLDGMKLCQKLKSELTIPPYIILLTQLSGTANIVKALDAGADEFIAKPFNHLELRSRILVGMRIVECQDKLTRLLIAQVELLNQLYTLIDKSKL